MNSPGDRQAPSSDRGVIGSEETLRAFITDIFSGLGFTASECDVLATRRSLLAWLATILTA